MVPAVPFDRFRAQIKALLGEYSIVPLGRLDADDSPGDPRPSIALTFDDDYACHARLVAPWLATQGVAATFFWSGRDQLGLGPYWWQRLESAIRSEGLGAVASVLGLSARTPAHLAAQIEGTDRVELIRSWAVSDDDLASDSDAGRLAALGFDVGFHTARHDRLMELSDVSLADALAFGRHELAATFGQPIDRIAYPHGKAGVREAEAARSAGFSAGYTGTGRPVAVQSDPLLRSRWEPGPMAPSRLVRDVAVRLNRRDDAPSR